MEIFLPKLCFQRGRNGEETRAKQPIQWCTTHYAAFTHQPASCRVIPIGLYFLKQYTTKKKKEIDLPVERLLEKP